jgi:hypothetical protein
MKFAGHFVVLAGGFVFALMLPLGIYIPPMRPVVITLGALAVVLMVIGRKWTRE